MYTFVVLTFRILPVYLSEGSVAWSSLWHQVSPLIFSSAALFPLIAYGSIRFSHRFVGPVGRFRAVIQEINRGESPTPVRLRANDFLGEFGDDLNVLIQDHNTRLAESATTAAKAPTEPSTASDSERPAEAVSG